MQRLAPIPKNPASKAKFAERKRKKLAEVFKSETTSFQYFPQGFQKSNKFGEWASLHLIVEGIEYAGIFTLFRKFSFNVFALLPSIGKLL